jgi:hypothetical protein
LISFPFHFSFILYFVYGNRLQESRPEEGGSLSVRNVGTYLQVHMAPQLRRPPSTSSVSGTLLINNLLPNRAFTNKIVTEWWTQPPAQWVPGALSPGVKRGRGVMLTTHPLLVPRFRKSRSYTSSHPNAPLWSVTGPLYPFYRMVTVRRVEWTALLAVHVTEVKFITVLSETRV